MKKNKTIAFAMAACLLVGGTFMGTKALFTDKAEAANDLVITMGNLNVDVEEGEWQIENEGSEAQNPTNKDRFTNVKPGDSFLKEVIITNNGSLKQKIKVSGGYLSGSDISKYVSLGQSISELDNKILEPGKSVKTYLNVTVLEQEDKKDNFGEGLNQAVKPTFNFNELNKTYKIDAEQTDEAASNLPDMIALNK